MLEDVYKAIYEWISKTLNVNEENLNPSTNVIADLGAKSFDVAHLAVYLEGEFDMDVPYMAFSKNKTIEQMAQFVVDRM